MTDFPSFPADGDKRIVYVREVKTADLPEEIRAQTTLDHLYAIHAPTGEVLALVPDRGAGLRGRAAERVLAGQRPLTGPAGRAGSRAPRQRRSRLGAATRRGSPRRRVSGASASSRRRRNRSASSAAMQPMPAEVTACR